MKGVPTFLGIEQTTDLLVKNFEWFKEGGGPGNYLPLMLWGEKGIGKTTSVKMFVKQIAEKYGISVKLSILKLSTMQPFTVIGYPYTEKVTKGDLTLNVQRHAIPEFMVEGLDYDYHVIFFDELNRGRGEVQNAIMGMLDGDGINEHALLKNTFIVGAGNPPNENYGLVEAMEDSALLDRMFHVNVATTRSETLNYMLNTKSIAKSMYTFLSEDQERIQKKDIYDPITSFIVPSDRAHAMVGRFINYVKDDEILSEAAAKGLLGDNDGSLYIERLNHFESIFTPDEILDSLNAAKIRTITELITPDGNGLSRLDVVNRLNDNMVVFLNQKARVTLTKKQLKNLQKYLELVPHDQRAMILTKAKFHSSEMSFLKVDISETLEATDFDHLEFN